MTSLFADQFGYRSPYGLGPLATGVPSIGIRLPQGKGNPASEGANVGANAAAGATAGAAAEAANGIVNGQSQDQSGTVGTAGQQAAARQGTLKKLMYLNRDDTATSPAPAQHYAPGSFDINLTKPSSGANASTPSPEWGVKQPKVTPQTYINQTPASPHSMPTDVHPVHVAGGTEWMPNTPSPQPTNRAPAIFGPDARVGSPGIWDIVKGTGGQLVHDVATAGHDMANIFQNQNSFGDKNFQVPNTPGGYSTSTGSAGSIAQHGQPWSAYTNVPGSNNGVASPSYDVGVNEGPGNYGGYGQAAANDVGGDASHFNWAQFFRTAAGDAADEG